MIYNRHKNSKRRILPFRLNNQDIVPLIQAAGIIALLAKLFYDSFLGALLLLPLAVLFLKRERARRHKERVRRIGIQFKDTILSVAASQRAGYSAENAFIEAARDMTLLHGRDSDIVQELKLIAKGLHNNLTLEDLLSAFAARWGHPDITEFAEVFRVAKRDGGNLNGVIADTADIIADKLETERQIGVMIAAKRLEARLMEIVPLFIILYVSLTNRGFFAPLYHNLFGFVFMTAALAVYLGAYLLTEKIVSIEV